MTTQNSENTNEGHSLDRLVGRLGWLLTTGENVRVKITAINAEKQCPKCGGPWGTIETQGHAMVGSGMMSLDGTTGEGCLNDVIVDDTDRDRASAPTVRDELPPLASGVIPAREADKQEACQKSRRDGGSLDRSVGIISSSEGAIRRHVLITEEIYPDGRRETVSILSACRSQSGRMVSDTATSKAAQDYLSKVPRGPDEAIRELQRMNEITCTFRRWPELEIVTRCLCGHPIIQEMYKSQQD